MSSHPAAAAFAFAAASTLGLAGVHAKTIYWDTATGDNSSSSQGNWSSGQTVWTNDSAGKSTTIRQTYSAIGGTSASNGVYTVDVVFAAGSNSSDINDNASIVGSIPVVGITVKDGYLTLANGGSSPDLKIYEGGITIGVAKLVSGVTTFNTSTVTGHDHTIASGIVTELGAAQTWTNNAATNFNVFGSVRNLSASVQTLTLNAASGADINLAGAVLNNSTGGSLAVVVNSAGGGNVVLGNGNSYTGGTTLTVGKVVAQNATAFGAVAGGISAAKASIDLAVDTSIAAYNTTLTDNATIQSDLFTSGAGITHTLGTLTFKPGASQLNIGAGAAVVSGTAGVKFGATTLADAMTFNVANSASAIASLTLGPLSETVGGTAVTKSGAGTLVLSGANTYSGRTTVSAGTVGLAAGAKLNNGVATVAMNGATAAAATLDLSTVGSSFSLGSLSGIGTVKLAPGEQLSIAAAGSLNSSGTADTLRFTGGDATTSLQLGGSSTFEINPAAGIFDSVSLAGQQLNYNNSVLNLVFSGDTSGYHRFQIFQFGQSTGTLARVNVSGVPDGTVTSYDPTTGYVTVGVPEPAGLILLVCALPLLRRRKPL